MTVVSLTKTTKSGELYQRQPEVQQLITELVDSSPDRLIQRCSNYNDPVPLEALLYLVRNLSQSTESCQLEAVFKAFFTRIEASLRKYVPDAQFDRSLERQEIMDRLLKMIAEDRNGAETALDFYELRFNKAFANLRKDVNRHMKSSSKTNPLSKSVPLTGASHDGIDVLPEVEESAREIYELGLSKLDDPSFRSRLYGAINDLPDDERHVVGLMLDGIQTEAKDPNTRTVSKILGCADRTVRNRLRRAYAKLREKLLVEEER